VITRRLSRGLQLTELGFGGAQLGNLYRAITDEEAAGAVRAAWDAGIRYFDTAPHYGLGLSERRLGESLQAYPRAEFVLSTKVGRWLEPRAGGTEQDPEGFAVTATHERVWDFSRDGVLRQVEVSLRRLGLDHLDLVLIHDPDDHAREALDVAAPTLSQLRSEGTIGGYGAGMNQTAVLARFVRETDVDVVMVAGRYTLLDQSAAEDLLPAALDAGVGVINAGIFNSGLLSQPRPLPESHYAYAPPPADVFERTQRLASACESFGVDLPTAAVAFAARHPAVTSVVVGLRTAAQVHDLTARWDRTVPEELWTALQEQGLLAESVAAPP
jgi:aryl-alcohol dehydrogenase-like predicted oxidoreductase